MHGFYRAFLGHRMCTALEGFLTLRPDAQVAGRMRVVREHNYIAG